MERRRICNDFKIDSNALTISQHNSVHENSTHLAIFFKDFKSLISYIQMFYMKAKCSLKKEEITKNSLVRSFNINIRNVQGPVIMSLLCTFACETRKTKNLFRW